MTDQQYYDIADEEFLKSMLKQRRSFDCGVGPITEGPPTIAQNLDLYQVPVVNNPCIIPSSIMAINSTERNRKKISEPKPIFHQVAVDVKGRETGGVNWFRIQ